MNDESKSQPVWAKIIAVLIVLTLLVVLVIPAFIHLARWTWRGIL